MVLKLTPLVRPAIDVDFATLEEMVKGMFQSRRKIIRHGAKSVMTKNQTFYECSNNTCHVLEFCAMHVPFV